MNDSIQTEDTKIQVLVTAASLVLLAFLFVGCATEHKEVVSAKAPAPAATAPSKNFEPRTVVDDNEVNLMARVEFEQGSDQLTAVSKKRISRALAQAQTLGTVNQVKVLSWGDQEYPSAGKKKLSDSQKALAARRSEAVRKYMRTINGDDRLDIYDYNMAKRPNPVSEFFKTSDARVKDSMEAAGVATTDHKREKSRRASSSLVIINLADSPQVVDLNYQTF